MKPRIVALTLATLAFAVVSAGDVSAQAAPTASRAFDLSVFGGLTANNTGLLAATNLSITAGGDLGLRRRFGVYSALEIRGMYPLISGGLVQEKNILGGLKVAKAVGRANVYGDALFGRGELLYINGFINPEGTVEYLENPTNVFSVGGGADLRLTDRFSVKVDAQLQRYDSPVVTSGHLYSIPVTLAVVYHFNFGHFPVR